jgi:hypothetical protein
MDKGKSSHAPVQAGLPEGFQQSGSANAVGWFDMNTIGNVLSGKLTGMYIRKDSLRTEGTSNFFQVLIDKVCQVRAERGEDAKIVTANPGDYVNVNYGPKTKAWESFISQIVAGAVYAVYGIIAGDKMKIGGGKKMHNFVAGHKMLVAPPEQDDAVGEVFDESTSGTAAVS